MLCRFAEFRRRAPGSSCIFVGGLIPCKACDLGCARPRAFCEVIWRALLCLAMVQSGPVSRSPPRALGIEKAVSFCGWVSHAEVRNRLRSADVMVVPVRDFGAGVVFEALATGAVPVVADFGGPGDIVHSGVGFKVPLTNEDEFVARMERILTELAHDRSRLEQLRQTGMAYGT